MKRSVKYSIRIILSLLSILFLFFAYKSFMNDIDNKLNLFVDNFLNINWDLILFFLIFFYVFLVVAIYWSKSLKKFSSVFISLGVLFLTIYLFLAPISSNVDEISSSIQPSIDLIVADSLNEMIDIDSNISKMYFEILISNNTKIEHIYIKNITKNQTNIIIQALNLNLESYKQEEIVAKVLISSIYDEMQKQNSLQADVSDIPIPIDEFKEQLDSQMDLSIFESEVDVSLLDSLYDLNNDANLKFLLSQDVESLILDTSNLVQDDIEQIWSGLNFNKSLEFEQKQKSLQLFFNMLDASVDPNVIDTSQPIPVHLVSIEQMLPLDLKYMFNTTIFSNNLTKQMLAIQDIRDNCEKNTYNESTICDAIMITKYENFIDQINTLSKSNNENGIDEISKELGFSVDANFSNMNFSQYSTIEKLENKIEEFSSKSTFFFLLFIIFIFLGTLMYYLYLRFTSQERSHYKILYFVFYSIFINYLFYFIFILIIYYIFKQNLIFNFLTFLNSVSSFDFSFFAKLPIYKVFMSIFEDIIFLSFIFLVVFLIIFMVFFFLNNTKDFRKPYKFNLFKNDNIKDKNSKKSTNWNDNNQSNQTMSIDESKVKNYILEYKNVYSRESIENALRKTDINFEDIEKYLKKYFDN
ncbi:MAG: hypothetical protein ACOC16_02700 [Nanoarchaeota archaeon]